MTLKTTTRETFRVDVVQNCVNIHKFLYALDFPFLNFKFFLFSISLKASLLAAAKHNVNR